MGKYHPHGDLSSTTPGAHAQPFSMAAAHRRSGNFGSVDNDPPAAMRYTECRLTRAAMAIMADLDKDTVDFKETTTARRASRRSCLAHPNLLVNGAGGIAVGMPPTSRRYLGEIVDACLALIDRPDIPLEEFLDIVRARLPTGARSSDAPARQALITGRGSVVVRGVAAIERSARTARRSSSPPFPIR